MTWWCKSSKTLKRTKTTKCKWTQPSLSMNISNNTPARLTQTKRTARSFRRTSTRSRRTTGKTCSSSLTSSVTTSSSTNLVALKEWLRLILTTLPTTPSTLPWETPNSKTLKLIIQQWYNSLIITTSKSPTSKLSSLSGEGLFAQKKLGRTTIRSIPLAFSRVSPVPRVTKLRAWVLQPNMEMPNMVLCSKSTWPKRTAQEPILILEQRLTSGPSIQRKRRSCFSRFSGSL